jgi:hypothetical protein
MKRVCIFDKEVCVVQQIIRIFVRIGCGRLCAYAGFALGVCILFWIGNAAYQSLNNEGWIPHTHDTPVWIDGDWIIGEYRECEMLTKANGWLRVNPMAH